MNGAEEDQHLFDRLVNLNKDDKGHDPLQTSDGGSKTHQSYGATEDVSSPFNRFKKKTWSFDSNSHRGIPKMTSSLRSKRDKTSLMRTEGGLHDEMTDTSSIRSGHPFPALLEQQPYPKKDDTPQKGGFLYYIIYAIVNVIISVPGLYGYAAVIFSHESFSPHMNALSKLVILSSGVHQLSFCLFSGLPFAIGTVQDAGLIFLSAMSTKIANRILEEGGTEEQVISTAMVLLSVGTASLGLVLMVMGYFRMADAVSYLPMPVIGGYLAFIGYFCLMAGVALCISENMVELKDWAYLLDPNNILLAVPGLLAGLVLTLISRKAKSDAALPLAMVAIPAMFYLILIIAGIDLQEARDAGWVGKVAPSVPAKDLLGLVDFSLVRWDLLADIFPTWVGMVFVVSFASCLDVAAISMDMGEALDTNKELATVGVGNLMSGLTFGYTGSYIFSQTIFTYRTGVHSKWIGVFIMIMFAYVVVSPMNLLQISPLFFLGSTLIFIGFDLVYEWLIEVREKIFLSEYIIVWATFIAIQIVGMDIGILIGVLVSIVDHVVHTATTTGVYRVNKKSRAPWTPEEQKVLQRQGYSHESPRIVTLEVVGSVFFGSSLFLLQRITSEIGIDMSASENDTGSPDRHIYKSPRASYFIEGKATTLSNRSRKKTKASSAKRIAAKFVVLDLSKLNNLDASAARGCFLQLAKMCEKRGITVCACGASARVEWMLRSHDVAYELEEEETMKARYANKDPEARSERLLLFITVHEALEFCENLLVQQMTNVGRSSSETFLNQLLQKDRQKLSVVLGRILGSSSEEQEKLRLLDGQRFHEELRFQPGDVIYSRGTNSDSFYVVLHGAAAVAIESDDPRHHVYKTKHSIMSGAGIVQQRKSSSTLLQTSFREDSTVLVASVWPVGGIFGYVDCLLERQRVFTAVATQVDTIVAKISNSHMQLIQNENPTLDGFLQRVLLKTSLLDLSNCTCDE